MKDLDLNRRLLFGLPSKPWPTFRAIDDRVRGGSSTSSFTPSPISQTATFAGHLDTKTLGGAGFASQCTTFSPRLSLPTRTSSGLLLTLIRPLDPLPTSLPTAFVLTLKNDKPEMRQDGRRESVVNYEFRFDLRELGEGERVVRAEWGEFKAVYRGREDKEAGPLDPSKIYELSFMCRSDFGKQEGDFTLEVVSLEVLDKPRSTPLVAYTGWSGAVWLWLAGWATLFSRWWNPEGALRLP